MGAMLSAREAEHATLMRYGMSDRERLRRIERDLEVVEEAWQRNGHINSMHTEEELLVHSAVNSMRNQAYILRCTIEARRGARCNLTRPLKKAKTSKQTRSSTTVSRVRFVDTLENTVQGKVLALVVRASVRAIMLSLCASCPSTVWHSLRHRCQSCHF